MFHAMKHLGIEYSYNDYPECLKPYFHRRIWEDELGNIRREIFAEDFLKNPIFIKPKDKLISGNMKRSVVNMILCIVQFILIILLGISVVLLHKETKKLRYEFENHSHHSCLGE